MRTVFLTGQTSPHAARSVRPGRWHFLLLHYSPTRPFTSNPLRKANIMSPTHNSDNQDTSRRNRSGSCARLVLRSTPACAPGNSAANRWKIADCCRSSRTPTTVGGHHGQWHDHIARSVCPTVLHRADLNVTLNMTHTRDEDLDVFLIAPDGTRVELFTDVGGTRGRTSQTPSWMTSDEVDHPRKGPVYWHVPAGRESVARRRKAGARNLETRNHRRHEEEHGHAQELVDRRRIRRCSRGRQLHRHQSHDAG